MLYHLLFPLADDISVFNLFRYLTFRTGGAVLTALIISFMLGSPMIRLLRSQQAEGQPIRDDGPEGHPLTKKGTPTMGGFLILIALSAATLLWADLSNRYVWAVLLVTLGFGGIGTPVRGVHPQIAYAARGTAHAATVVLPDVFLKITAIVFLAILFLIPSGCAFIAKTVYINPRDGPQRLDVRAGPIAEIGRAHV